MAPAHPHRVAIDGHAFADGSQFRGIGTYLRHVVAGVAERPDFDVSVLAPAGAAVPPAARLVPVRRRLPARWQRWEHDLLMPHEVRGAGVGLLHSPAQRPPRSSPVPWVQTLHDLTPLVFRHPLLEPDRRWWLRVGPRLAAAAAVICVSRSSADQAVRLLGLPARRLHVVPLGVDPAFGPTGTAMTGDPPYLLWVGAWGPHKGLVEALSVVAALADAGYPHRLVLAGRQDAWMAARIREQVGASRRPDRVDIPGYVDDLPALYRGATALLMTSRAEGFGLPALEALACGTPVVAFANTSLPEVVGDAGVLVKDGDVAAMTREVCAVIDDGTLAADLRGRGLRRAGAFTWQRTIDAHAEVFAHVIAAS